MKSQISHTVNDERQYKTMVIATMVIRKRRHQMCVCMFERLAYAEAMKIATPSIEAWESSLDTAPVAADVE